MVATLTNQKMDYSPYLQLIANENPKRKNLYSLRQKALSYLQELPFPTSSDESWRRIPLNSSQIVKFLESISLSPVEKIQIETHSSIVCKQLDELEEREIQFVSDEIEKAIENNKQNYFFLLNLVFYNTLFLVDVPKDIVFDKIISLRLDFSSSNSFFSPLVIANFGKFSKGKWKLEYSIPSSDEIVFFNSAEILHQADSSQLIFHTVENFSDSVFHTRNIFSSQEKDSALQLGYFNLNGYRGKTFIHSHLKGEGSKVNLLGIAAPTKRELQDVEFVVHHGAGHTESDLLFRVVLKDKAHHIFSGVLQIPKTSLHVVANQLNNNLKLQKTARAESMPKLEVYADDVRCSHGATMGEVSEDQMFYLTSRGLSEEEAKHLIVEGFLMEVLEPLGEEEFSRELVDRFLQKLSV
jgi:FeS assembly protein SufD